MADSAKGQLNGNTIKYIAILAMLIDHIAILVDLPVSVYFIMRIIGRLTAPVMCFFIAEGFRHTSSRKKYAVRLLIFAVISQFPYVFFHYGTILTWQFLQDYNVIFTLLLSFWALWCYELIKNKILKWLTVLGIVILSVVCDWGGVAPLLTLTFYIFRDNKGRQAIAYAVLSLATVLSSVVFCLINGYNWYGELWQVGMLLFLPFIWLYNGERGSRRPVHKWIFYVFYPLHLFVLGALGAWVI